MEERLHALLRQWIGQHAPRPYHVVVNGWYFYSINWLSGGALARSLPDILWHLVRSPRRVAGVIPPTVRHSVPVFEREWREDLLPRYRAAVAGAESRVETLAVTEMPALISELADLAGEYFGAIAALTGAAYKMEMNLARFYRRHLGGSLGGSHLPLLAGFEPPSDPGRYAVVSLDWWHAPSPLGAKAETRPAEDHARLVEGRQAAEAAAFRSLASSPRAFAGLPQPPRRDPAPRPDARGAGARADDRVAGHATGGVAHGETLAARGEVAEPSDVSFPHP